jgi:two-component system, response regulator PdtaR
MVSSRPDPAPAKADGRPPLILFVEDEILIRAAVAEYLRKLGYIVVEAADAAEAMAVFSSGEPIDVVLCDVDLPGTMDGLSLARWISRRPSAPPVLLTSGRIARPTRKTPTGFIMAKPYHLAELAACLESMLASGDPAADDTEPR